MPVDLVFFFRQLGLTICSRSSRARAAPTESELDLRAWTDIAAANPGSTPSVPDVKRNPLRRHQDGFSCHLVPIDVCYELVGTVRLKWTGLGGGLRCGGTIDAFFADLDRRATPVARPPRGTGWGRHGTDASRDTAVDVDFTCDEVVADRYAAGPTVAFKMRATERSGTRVHAVALRCQVRVEPVRRSYSDARGRPRSSTCSATIALGPDHAGDAAGVRGPGAARLHRGDDVRPVDAVQLRRRRGGPQVPRRRSRTARCPCSCSSAARSSRVTGEAVGVPVPWHKETPVRMPVSVWREAIDAHFPEPGLDAAPARTTFDDLADVPGKHGLLGWDDTLEHLWGGTDDGARREARAVADAVLYEGYVLYPYRACSSEEPGALAVGGADAARRRRARSQRALVHTRSRCSSTAATRSSP